MLDAHMMQGWNAGSKRSYWNLGLNIMFCIVAQYIIVTETVEGKKSRKWDRGIIDEVEDFFLGVLVQAGRSPWARAEICGNTGTRYFTNVYFAFSKSYVQNFTISRLNRDSLGRISERLESRGCKRCISSIQIDSATEMSPATRDAWLHEIYKRPGNYVT